MHLIQNHIILNYLPCWKMVLMLTLIAFYVDLCNNQQIEILNQVLDSCVSYDKVVKNLFHQMVIFS